MDLLRKPAHCMLHDLLLVLSAVVKLGNPLVLLVTDASGLFWAGRNTGTQTFLWIARITLLNVGKLKRFIEKQDIAALNVPGFGPVPASFMLSRGGKGGNYSYVYRL